MSLLVWTSIAEATPADKIRHSRAKVLPDHLFIVARLKYRRRRFSAGEHQ